MANSHYSQDVADGITDSSTPNSVPLSLYVNVDDIPDTPPIITVQSINTVNEPAEDDDPVR